MMPEEIVNEELLKIKFLSEVETIFDKTVEREPQHGDYLPVLFKELSDEILNEKSEEPSSTLTVSQQNFRREVMNLLDALNEENLLEAARKFDKVKATKNAFKINAVMSAFTQTVTQKHEKCWIVAKFLATLISLEVSQKPTKPTKFTPYLKTMINKSITMLASIVNDANTLEEVAKWTMENVGMCMFIGYLAREELLDTTLVGDWLEELRNIKLIIRDRSRPRCERKLDALSNVEIGLVTAVGCMLSKAEVDKTMFSMGPDVKIISATTKKKLENLIKLRARNWKEEELLAVD